ncbi:MAG TPA: hypothetical protein VNZ54_01845 [bacterium]|nr:hypothetical protein [bacterium]
MNLAGWGAGLAALALAGCASLPQAGLTGRAEPLERADGTPRQRGQAFLEHRVALNLEGAEVGHAHLDRPALAAYLQASGAPDLAAVAGQPARTWTDHGPGPWAWWSPVADEDQLGFPAFRWVSRDLDNAKDSPDRDLAPVVVEFNRRLAQRLNLAVGDAWLAPTPQSRDPLPQARVEAGPNQSLEDWAADYRLRFDAVRSYNRLFYRDRALGSFHWTGGGRILTEGTVAGYMQDQGQPALAKTYRNGRILRWVAGPLIELGALVFGGGAALLIDPNSRQSAAVPMGVGAAIAAGGCLSLSVGLSDGVLSVDAFNQSLLPAVRARAGAVAKGAP